MDCLLCHQPTLPFFSGQYGEYFRCQNCQGIALAPDYFPSSKTEKARYETHNNDVTDRRYQNFVSPIVEAVLAVHSPEEIGLDFGCGTGPVIHYLLTQQGFQVDRYDPFFYQNPSIFTKTYDFIICCEVVEHFQNPNQEFARLYSLLKPQGKLYCMTQLYRDDINFPTWGYKNDPTHLFFYHPVTFDWIQTEYGFRQVEIEGRLICLEK